jgi:hypothetical protein
MTRKDLTGVDGQHWQQAEESLLPTALRAPWLSQPRPERDMSGRDATGDASVTAGHAGSESAHHCRCGCGELLDRAPAGRTRLFVSHAHRQRAYRARKA